MQEFKISRKLDKVGNQKQLKIRKKVGNWKKQEIGKKKSRKSEEVGNKKTQTI